MTELTITRNGDSADFELPRACLLCQGPLAVRVTPAGAASVCLSCVWIDHPSVQMDGRSLQIAFGPAALA